MEYTFTLQYQVPESESPDALLEQLGAGGCDDALVGSGRPGRIALEFTREADNASDAVSSAVADVRRAIPTATLIEASSIQQ
jgi:hypothetical protein